MPLNDNLLKQQIISITDNMMQQEDYEAAKEVYADMLVNAFRAYLTTATLTITGTSSVGPITGTAIIT